jgi:cytosine permease
MTPPQNTTGAVKAITTNTDFELGSVPRQERRGWLAITMIWVTIGIDVSGTMLGLELASGMNLGPALAATVLGSVLLGLLAIGCSYIGARTGLTTSMISRAVFGTIGGRLIAAMIVISSLGWFAVQTGFFASYAQHTLQDALGWSVPAWVLAALGGALMLLTAVLGYRAIQKLSLWAVPLLLALLGLGTVLALSRYGTSGLSEEVEATLGFGTAVSLVMSIFILGVVLTPDMARWAKTPGHAMASGFVGFFLGNSIIVVVAILFTKLTGSDQILSIFIVSGLGVVALAVLTIAQWSTNTTNAYSASLSLAAILPRVPRRVHALVGGSIAIVAACFGFVDWFIPFISLMGTLLAPYGGVYVASLFFRMRAGGDVMAGERQQVRWPSLLVWAAACLVALATTDPSAGLGFGWFTLTTIPTLDGLLAGLLFQSALSLTASRRHREALA